MSGTSTESKHKVRKRKTIDMEQKMKIITKFENGQKLSSIAREFSLASSTVKTILKDRERIKGHVQTVVSLKSTVITKKRAGAISVMEKLLSEWIKDQTAKNAPLSLITIQTKARSLFEDLKLKLGDTEAKFVASNGWFHRFKARADIPKLIGDVANGQTKAIESYPSILKKIIEDGGYTMHQIYNVGQTELFWKKLPSKNQLSEEQAQEDKMIVLLGCNVVGDHKLKPFSFIHSGFLSEVEKIKQNDPSLNYRLVSETQMTVELFEEWLLKCFIPEVEIYCRENNIPIKILLILDDSPCYSAHLNDYFPNIKIVFLPPNSSAILQPLNQGLISTFKSYYLRQTLQQAAEEIGNYKTPGEFWKYFKIYHAVQNIVKAWEDVTKMRINFVWKKLCPQFVTVESNDCSTTNDCQESTTEIIDLSKRLGIEVNTADTDELQNACSTEPTSKKPIERVDAKQAEVKSFEQLDSFDTKEMTTAFREIASAMARFQKMDPDSSRFLKVKNEIEKSLTCYQNILEEKKRTSELTNLSEEYSYGCISDADRIVFSLSPPQCTALTQDAFIVPVDPDDIMLISSFAEYLD